MVRKAARLLLLFLFSFLFMAQDGVSMKVVNVWFKMVEMVMVVKMDIACLSVSYILKLNVFFIY